MPPLFLPVEDKAIGRLPRCYSFRSVNAVSSRASPPDQATSNRWPPSGNKEGGIATWAAGGIWSQSSAGIGGTDGMPKFYGNWRPGQVQAVNGYLESSQQCVGQRTNRVRKGLLDLCRQRR